MFGLFKRKPQPDVTARLSDQVLGGQSVLFRFFREDLDTPENSIQKLELTYLAMSVLTRAYLTFAHDPEASNTLDSFSSGLLRNMHTATKAPSSFEQTVADYQARYREYQALLSPVLRAPAASKLDPTTTLLLHAFEKVTRTSANGSMLKLMVGTSFMNQFIADNVDFVRNVLKSNEA